MKRAIVFEDYQVNFTSLATAMAALMLQGDENNAALALKGLALICARYPNVITEVGTLFLAVNDSQLVAQIEEAKKWPVT